MDKKNGKQLKYKGGIGMNAVLSLDEYKLNSSNMSKQKNINPKKKVKLINTNNFFEENIDDIVELELNNTSVDEFIIKLSKKE